jgi:amino acid adenylation domain-containing protein
MLNVFLSNFKKYPSNNALCINNCFYTYKDLEIIVSRIKKQIQDSNQIKNPIGIIANNDIETYSSILAVLFTGYGYVIINPSNPADRNVMIIEQSNLNLILTSDSNYAQELINGINNVHLIDTKKLKSGDEVELRIDSLNNGDLAYLLFTSGSTGIPKGVPITWENLNSFIDSFNSIGFKIDANDRWLQMFDLTFDVSVACFLIPLYYGACVYTVPTNEFKYPSIYKILKDYKLTIVTMVPSLIAYFKPYLNELLFENVKYCILTAEPSYNNSIEEWSTCIPNAKIYNLYGPTEATIWCFHYQWNRNNFNEKGYKGSASIGIPMKNVEAILIDDENKIINTPNKKGELCLAGHQITKGYWNNIEKNNSAFAIFHSPGNNQRFYKTGDLCFKDTEGYYMYSGRIDYQVQVQGFRVELNELEYPVKDHFKIQNAIAIPIKDDNGLIELILFIENFSGSTLEVLEFLKSKLPAYMLPKKIINKKAFPLNTSNKVDRKELLNIYLIENE